MKIGVAEKKHKIRQPRAYKKHVLREIIKNVQNKLLHKNLLNTQLQIIYIFLHLFRMRLLALFLSLLGLVQLVTCNGQGNIICYIEHWSDLDQQTFQYDICTHIIYYLAEIDGKGNLVDGEDSHCELV